MLSVYFGPIIDAISVGIAGIVTAGLTAVGAICAKNFERERKNRKIKDAIEDAVLATEEKANADPELKGEKKYEHCANYAKSLLMYDGITPPDDIVMEAMIHSKLCSKKDDGFKSYLKKKEEVTV